MRAMLFLPRQGLDFSLILIPPNSTFSSTFCCSSVMHPQDSRTQTHSIDA